MYAFGVFRSHEGWPVTISMPGRHAEVIETIVLADNGLGGSGTARRRHIIDPRTARPVEGRRAAWVVSETAARSDALSTACMVMTVEEIRTCIARDPRLRAVVVEGNGDSVLRFGGPVSV